MVVTDECGAIFVPVHNTIIDVPLIFPEAGLIFSTYAKTASKKEIMTDVHFSIDESSQGPIRENKGLYEMCVRKGNVNRAAIACMVVAWLTPKPEKACHLIY